MGGLRTLRFFLLTALVCVNSGPALALTQHRLLRRIAVFPIYQSNIPNAEEAWWQMRGELTKDQRFFVASRRFMVNRGVFQPRQELKNADVVILGKILEAQVLIVSYIEERKLNFKVYDGENGNLIWESVREFDPVLPMGDKIVQVAQQLTDDFIMSLPYQGFVVVDSKQGKPLFEENNQRQAWVYCGKTARFDVGDPLQIIEFTGPTPLLKEGETTVIAEGSIVEIQKERVLASIERMRSGDDIKENALVRFPKESKNLQQAQLNASPPKDASLGPEYLAAEMVPADQIGKRHQSAATSLAFILGLAGMILLAF
ncbi:MAG: hypothetical protein C5B49_13865 [Bdellovibrio sp.]|nr:MAG: hypothetical protein C5B49_13865 [Bdellovibrio sp.]